MTLMTKSYTEYLTFNTRKRYEMVHITDQVEAIVRRSGIVDGLCFISPMHITAAIYVNDHESGLIEDIALLHHETTVPVTQGQLDFGTWQRIFYAEFDGQRSKRVIVKVLGVTEASEAETVQRR
jgi:thiamine phosphate synthase YjbQ (UPF0047 family)